MKLISYKKVPGLFRKLHWKELLALFFILVAIFFFRHQRRELLSIGASLRQANQWWITIGLVVAIGYILLQAALYIYSFKAIGGKISIVHAVELFLKRNLISVFLPAGAISSLAYLPANIRKGQVHKQQVHQASAIYAFIGIFSVFIVGIPVLIYLAFQNASVPGASAGLLTLIGILGGMILLVRTIRSKGKLYQRLIKGRPKVEHYIQEIFSFELKMSYFWLATLVSVVIEFTGIFHIYIAMKAIGVNPSIEAAIVGYIVATIFLIISPFLRGIGAIELSLTFILNRYGFSTLQSLQITLLFRSFEFWLPLVAGIISFAAKAQQLFFRLLPAVLILLLGLVNVFSVLTPPITSRMRLLRQFIPVESIQASNILIILIGLTLVITARFLVKGLRSAWTLSILLCVVSGLGHMSKALDYEEAILSVIVLVVLLATSRQYRLKSNPRLLNIGIVTGFATFAAVLVFGSIAFYFMDVRHFGINFSSSSSISNAFKSFVLVQNEHLKPLTPFAKDFLVFINALGIMVWAFFLYCLVRPRIFTSSTNHLNFEKAAYLLKQFGDSPLDHFKISNDKLLFVSEAYNGFVAYRQAGVFAIVLEEPVCAEENKVALIKEFERDCKTRGLKPAYYRVDNDSLYYFQLLRKKKILIGQEAVLELAKFTLEGKDKKSMRNGLNSLEKKGYKILRKHPPLNGALLQALQQVSDEWLLDYEMEEAIFAQGKFDRDELKNQDVILVQDSEERVVGFLNIIPDYRPGECTYDLIRKTADAPGGVMDALIIDLIAYAKEQRLDYLNLGLVPMSGIEIAENPAETVVKFAYEKVKRFSNYKGLRNFKEKYATEWLDKFLVYENDFDLLQLPTALNKVMQPVQK